MKTSAPLSKVQYGIYVECVQHPDEASYNIPIIHVLDGSLDIERLRKAIQQAVAAHPTLFTRIELNEQGDPLQTIDDTETFSLDVEQTTDIEQHSFSPSTFTTTGCSAYGCFVTMHTFTCCSTCTTSSPTEARGESCCPTSRKHIMARRWKKKP